MAGKSTSVGALGRGLGSEVFTPAEVSGRTLYFDWLDYTGGLFEGRRIRCQIISVPGQATLAPRRRRLLESADSIIFVGDSSPAGFIADRGYLSGLSRVLDQLPGPPVGLVLQANKRDSPHAVPIDSIRSMLDSMQLRIGIIESIATNGNGVREAFVFAVRLALDRVRELSRIGELLSVRPMVDSPQELLDQLRQSEDGRMDYAAAAGLVHTRVSDVQPQSIVSEALAQAAMENEEQPSVWGGTIKTRALVVGDDATTGSVQAVVDAAVTGKHAMAESLADGQQTGAGSQAGSPQAAAEPHEADQPASSPASDQPAADQRAASDPTPPRGQDDPPNIPSETVSSGLIWPPVDGRTVLQELGQSRI
jgi:hypothetical protein